MSKPSQGIVLAEDSRHQEFVRRYLHRRGFREHHIYFEKLPSGTGSGEQWVRTRYARLVAVYRQRSARATTALIVVIDADTETVADRSKRLSDALSEAGAAGRAVHEQIVLFIPKRHIETWILCLNGTVVDEIQKYKNELAGSGGSIQTAAVAFFEWGRPNTAIPAHCIPSLSTAIAEAARLTAAP
ncbi:MAG: hypothetical protein EXQ57_04885 [Bryobacterales bacterium]|nr:hypothetical protein [Bryobacterales bacterium]